MAYIQYGRSILRRVAQDNSVSKSDGLFHPLIFTGQGVRYKTLEVILTTSIDKLGRAGETVKVAPGYFRNYLMPKLLAVPNIDKFAYLVREQRKIYEPKEEEKVKVEIESEEDKLKEYIAAAKWLDSGKLIILDYHSSMVLFSNLGSAELGPRTLESPHCVPTVLRRFFKIDNELREPVTKEEIVSEVARQLSVCIEPENLHMTNPLATLGEHEIPLRLPKAIPLPEGKTMWTLKVKIRRK
ncbi:hypothetical protein Cgig2_007201 [Carnegiea gigantea]|uniref:Large ribosomal subunit protein bL9c n=1 Tax=Carnegiea gigantea TaxID=171969 RepID=A0A9Q1GVU8_9CARY|nr:hypothetical protein Cgig2_007201 [Carnegiea gigantea]